MTALQVLRDYFGYETFRQGQEEIIDSILSGRDALAVMPTGAGKSVCYQIPALMMPGITLVVSPLISLMQDQVKALSSIGVRAAYVNSSLSERQIDRVLDLAMQNTYKIIYVAPERLEMPFFLDFASQVELSMVTVDEAHCISQWGQDFRPSYRKILSFVEGLPHRPVLSAFTATATPQVMADIRTILKLHEPRVVVTGFDRPNLYFQVERGGQKDEFVLNYLQEHPTESGIIYCSTRKNVDALYTLLRENGFSAVRYHAGIGQEERRMAQEDFIYDRVPIVVATNAFGMGIDKSNVRFVLHYNMPQSMENYYQEAGRAGRDGEDARCILLFSPQDTIIARFLMEKKEPAEGIDECTAEEIRRRDKQRLQKMETYCKITSCLRSYILNYFGETSLAPCHNCGNCLAEYEQSDQTAAAKWVINCIAEARERYGVGVITGTLLGSKNARMRELGTVNYRSYGKLSELGRNTLNLLITQMLEEGYLIKTQDDYPVLMLGNIQPLRQKETRVLVKLPLQHPKEKRTEKKPTGYDTLTEAGLALRERLRKCRFQMAWEEGIPPYIICSDRTLTDLCVKAPHSLQEMEAVHGLGSYKCRKYGSRFLEELNGYRMEYPNVEWSVHFDLSELVEQDEKEKAKEKAKEKKKEKEKINEVKEKKAETEEEEKKEEKEEKEERKEEKKEKKEKKARVKKEEKKSYFLTEADASSFQYQNLMYISEIRTELNRINTAENCKKVQFPELRAFLLDWGLVFSTNKEDGTLVWHATEEGTAAGVFTEERTAANGKQYSLLLYPPSIQERIVRAFVKTQPE